jgi:hypothetical protein
MICNYRIDQQINKPVRYICTGFCFMHCLVDANFKEEAEIIPIKDCFKKYSAARGI